MQGMRIKSHKGYFTNVKSTHFSFQTPWAAKPMVQPVAPKVISIQVKTAATAPKKRAAKATLIAKKTVAKRATAKRR